VAETSTSVDSAGPPGRPNRPGAARTTRGAESERYMATIYISRQSTGIRAGFRHSGQPFEAAQTLSGSCTGASRCALPRRQAKPVKGAYWKYVPEPASADEASAPLSAYGRERGTR
jgi:hypothetical protein